MEKNDSLDIIPDDMVLHPSGGSASDKGCNDDMGIKQNQENLYQGDDDSEGGLIADD